MDRGFSIEHETMRSLFQSGQKGLYIPDIRDSEPDAVRRWDLELSPFGKM